jgi:DnaJ-class molecular chaperone
MSLSQRLLRIAQRRLTDLAQGIHESADRAAARAELDGFLAGPGYRSAPPPPPDPLAAHYEALGAPVGANLETVERLWRRAVLENHPDRFMHDPVEQKRAATRLRRLNEAHEILQRELRRREQSTA